MANHELKGTRYKEDSMHSTRIQPGHSQVKQGTDVEADDITRTQIGLCLGEQASLINIHSLSSDRKLEAVFDLQQTYGNSYVQKLAEDGAAVTDRNQPAEVEAEQVAQVIANGDREVSLPQVRLTTMIARVGEGEPETATSPEVDTTLLPEEEAEGQSFEEIIEELASQWPMLASFETSEIIDHIQHGRREEALEALWDNIGWELPLASRITLELTASLGIIENEPVQPASASGLTLAYVLRQPACATAAAAHSQLHTPDEIQFYIQINPSVFHQSRDSAKLAMLLSTFMHEYTHVEQIASRPIDPRTAFMLKANNREFLGGEQTIPLPEREVLIAHDEIDAYASEIENAERTGLANEYNIGNTVGALWAHYVTYFNRTRNIPAQDVEQREQREQVIQRVHTCIQEGRDMFFTYLDSDDARSWLTASQRTLLRNNTPPGYDESLFPMSP